MEGQHDQEHLDAASPRIYAASLSDYNDGRLHGSWIDAAQPPEDVGAEIDDMLAASPTSGAEEWAIHDYEGFAGFEPTEYEDLTTLAVVARGIAEHGPVFAHWVSHVGTSDPELLDRFEDHYLGSWDDLATYAEQLLDDLGIDIEGFVPGWLSPYVRVDYEGLAQDLAADLYVTEGTAETHLFQP